jgi:hypothetical protein
MKERKKYCMRQGWKINCGTERRKVRKNQLIKANLMTPFKNKFPNSCSSKKLNLKIQAVSFIKQNDCQIFFIFYDKKDKISTQKIYKTKII